MRREFALGPAGQIAFSKRTKVERLARLPNPTLVVWGDEDKVNRPSGGPTLAATIPNCELWSVADAGHWVQWERADDFNQRVMAFLSEGDPARS